jgi:hypothetical protein
MLASTTVALPTKRESTQRCHQAPSYVPTKHVAYVCMHTLTSSLFASTGPPPAYPPTHLESPAALPPLCIWCVDVQLIGQDSSPHADTHRDDCQYGEHHCCRQQDGAQGAPPRDVDTQGVKSPLCGVTGMHHQHTPADVESHSRAARGGGVSVLGTAGEGATAGRGGGRCCEHGRRGEGNGDGCGEKWRQIFFTSMTSEVERRR